MNRIILLFFAILLSSPVWANVPNSTPLFNQYNCNSSTTQFPYAFPITATSDMTVYITDSLRNITPQSGTFSVDQTNLWVNYPLVGSPCSTGSTITLIPSTPQTQTTTYGARTPFTATAVGASFDKLTLIDQQIQGQINRAFLQPVNFTGTATFPSSNPGYLIGWNSSGVLSNITNPSLTAQWTLSGANISYNTGNVSTTNTMTASSGFVGNLTGNVVGSLTGNASTATTAGTVTTAAQPSITSVGTLTSLLVSGNVGINSTNPGQLLDIQGTIRALGGSFANNSVNSQGINWATIENYGTNTSSFVNSSNFKASYGVAPVTEGGVGTNITNLQFTSTSTYSCSCSVNTNTTEACQVVLTSGAQITVTASGGSSAINVNWMCIGY